MKPLSGKKLAKALERHGWVLRRIRGSHHVYTKPGSNVRLSIPIHGSKPLRVGLLSHFLKVSGLSEDDI
ncbi:MAG: type II toxin-antitoxin system HicA family toxin [Armatimonadetes bacterium]|nr:type II toxin-antitoxin system HicA family toxin [Armatimonadota bacterium]